MIFPLFSLFPGPVDDAIGFGFCDAPGNKIESRYFRETGADYVRMSVSWRLLEKPDGTWDFARYDNLIDTASADGLKIILLLCYDHPKLGHGDSRKILPREIPAFLEYTDKVVERWGNSVAGFEIWNEPNHPIFWKGSDEDFFELTRETVTHLKEKAPGTPVAVGSIMFNPWMGGFSYLRKLLDSGAADYADAVSIHPYGTWIPSQEQWVSRARTQLDEHGFTDKALWITEIGYPTKSLYPYRRTRDELPSTIAESLIRLSAAGATVITWFDLYTTHEAENTSGPYGSASFGLLYREAGGEYIPKNGLDTWGVVANALGGTEYLPGGVEIASDLKTLIRAYAYDAGDGKKVLCLWSKAGEPEIDINARDILLINTVTGDSSYYADGLKIPIGREPVICFINSSYGKLEIERYE